MGKEVGCTLQRSDKKGRGCKDQIGCKLYLRYKESGIGRCGVSLTNSLLNCLFSPILFNILLKSLMDDVK